MGEGYALLLDHLLLERGWLRRYADLESARVPAFVRAAAFQELYLLRRHAGKLRYELALHGGAALDDAPELYVSTMETATSVRHAAADAFVDVDARLYVARYLRGWQLQAVLADALRERFDEDWWRNPRAGPWLTGALMAEGQGLDAAGVAALATGEPARVLDFAPAVRTIERHLA